MSGNRFLSDLLGTLKSSFRVGANLWKVAGGLFQARNAADTENVGMQARSVDLIRPTGTNAVTLEIGSEPPAPITYRLPVEDGATDEVLKTDGAGNLAWGPAAVDSGSVKVAAANIAFNSASPVAMFTPPANATIVDVIVAVDTAFDASGASLSVGTAAIPAAYMGATDLALTPAGNTYETRPMAKLGATPDAVQVTFAAGSGGSAGAARVVVMFALNGA